MKNFNWESLKNNNAVHCDTEEEANDFLRQAWEHGFRWSEEDSLLDKTRYGYRGTNICYHAWSWSDKILSFSYMAYFQENNYNIIEWEIDGVKEFTEKDLKVGMLVKNKHYDSFGYGMIMPSKFKGDVVVYKDGTWGDINFDIVTEVWGYCNYVRKTLILDTDNRELLYVRKETKEMTIEEISKKLGYDVKIVKER